MPALRTTPLSHTWPQLLQPLGFTRRTIIWDAPQAIAAFAVRQALSCRRLHSAVPPMLDRLMNEPRNSRLELDPLYCLPLNAPQAALARVGGKGLNLTRLARAGFPVPGGFIVTVDAYFAFVTQAGLVNSLGAEAAAVNADDPDTLASLSDRLRTRFEENSIPDELSTPIRCDYAGLGKPLVAVRSSATAEDLPDMSFAGQQDTFLNVQGDEDLLAAIAACWSSLWTARAIGYRARNGIDQSSAAMAVVVQEMVQSETSGVLFTANPLSGRRAETVIDATFGLGEALVNGQVEPGHYVVESSSGRILEKRLGAKDTVFRGKDGGGITTIEEENSQRQAHLDSQIGLLTETGQRVAQPCSILPRTSDGLTPEATCSCCNPARLPRSSLCPPRGMTAIYASMSLWEPYKGYWVRLRHSARRCCAVSLPESPSFSATTPPSMISRSSTLPLHARL